MKVILYPYLFIGLFVFFLQASSNVKDIEGRLTDLTVKITEAAREGDFGFVAEQLHNHSLAYFQRTMLIYVDHLREAVEEEQFKELLGVSLDELEELPADVFFEVICHSAWKKWPEKMADPDTPELLFLGVVQDEPNFYHLLYRYNVDIESDVDHVRVRRPQVITFWEEGDEVKLWTMLYSGTIPRLWYREIHGSESFAPTRSSGN